MDVQERKKIAREREALMSKLTYTHNWLSIKNTYKGITGGNAMSYSISHCKDCGIHYLLFKYNPIDCKENQIKKVIK